MKASKKYSLFILLLTKALVSHAANLSISPINIEMQSTQKATLITVKSESSDPVDLQLRLYKWSQDSGQDVLKVTNDLIVSPPFVRVVPGESYNFRIVRADSYDKYIPEELAYRLIIDELPKPQDSRKMPDGLQVVLRTSIPIFINKSNAITDVHYSIEQESGASFILAKNTGARHALIKSISIKDKAGNKKHPVKVDTMNGYILPGSTRRYAIPDSIANGIQTFDVEVNGNLTKVNR